ncbi:MAG: hypothetical protein H6686_01320 [Fibrobacteria bacterium]|nr:hypothetical protein [Fibrobacteria bacterium]
MLASRPFGAIASLALLFPSLALADQPWFDDQTFFAPPDAQVGDDLGRFMARPFDSLPDLTFRILSGNRDGLFAIDDSGKLQIAVEGGLDHTDHPFDTLVLEASSTLGKDTARAVVRTLDPDRIRYFDPDAASGGDGSRSKPWKDASKFKGPHRHLDLLLRRGRSQGFPPLDSAVDVLVTAWGQGERPVTPGTSWGNSRDIFVDNIHFLGGARSITLGTAENTTINKCELETDPTVSYAKPFFAGGGPIHVNTLMSYCEIHNAREDAMMVSGMHGFTILNTWMHDVNLASIQPTVSEGHGDGIQHTGNGKHFVIRGSLIDRGNGHGKFCIILQGTHDGLTIEGNVFIGAQDGFGGAALYLAPEGNASEYIVRGNRFIASGRRTTGIYTWNDGIVENNVFIGWGTAANGGPDKLYRHNTYVDCNYAYSGNGSTFENNLMYFAADTQKSLGGNPVVKGRNLVSRADNSFPKSADVIVGDPLFVDLARGDFRLRTGSPAIDAAVGSTTAWDHLGIQRPQGKATDVGAFEFDEGSRTAVHRNRVSSPRWSLGRVDHALRIHWSGDTPPSRMLVRSLDGSRRAHVRRLDRATWAVPASSLSGVLVFQAEFPDGSKASGVFPGM